MATNNSQTIPDSLIINDSEIETEASKPSKVMISQVLAEEIETLKSILQYDISLQPSPQNDSLILTIPISCDNLPPALTPKGPTGSQVSFFITPGYPRSVPSILLNDNFLPFELEDHIQELSANLKGSIMIYTLYEAICDWLNSHGSELEANECMSKQEEIIDFNQFNVMSESTNQNAPFKASIHEELTTDMQSNNDSSNNKSKKKIPILNEKEQATQSKKKGRKKDKKQDSSLLSNYNESKEEQSPIKQKRKDDKDAEENEEKAFMKPATDVINRIIWDADLPTECFVIGYLDRFVGIIERPFSSFNWEDLASADITTLAIPKHRIQYFKYKTEVIWDKNVPIDKVFGSRGSKLTISDVIQQYDATHPKNNPPEATDETSGGTTNSELTYNDDVSDNIQFSELALLDDYEVCSAAISEIQAFNESRVINIRHDNTDRPNYFVSFKVINKQLVEQAKAIQMGVVNNCPLLYEACIPPERLHVSLIMIRIDTEEQMNLAIEVMTNFQKQLSRILPHFIQIEFDGIDCFRNQVVFAQVKSNSALTRVATALKIQFEEAGISTPGNHTPFTPHITLIKLSRGLSKQINTTQIYFTFYSEFKEVYLGKQPVQSLVLGSMFELNEEDGFYVRKVEVHNTVSCLRADLCQILINPILKIISTSDENLGVIPLLNNLLTETKGDSSESIDQILNLIMEHEFPINPGYNVIILRGVPGSGKSSLVSNSSEHKANPNSITCCSADIFFTEVTGEYRFDISKLAQAHESCLSSFLDGLVAQNPLIVVDNTNCQYWEYALYTCFAKCFGYSCHIIELACPDQDTLKLYQARNQHRVTYDACAAMVNRWEVNKMSVKLDFTQLPKSYSLLNLVKCPRSEDTVKSKLKAKSTTKPTLIAIYLTRKAKYKLNEVFPYVHSKYQAEHITLKYMPSNEEVLKYELGSFVKFRVLGSVKDDKVQTAVVEFIDDVHCQNLYPHVTLSISKLGTANHSNDLLTKTAKKTSLLKLPNRPEEDLILDGTIGVQVGFGDGVSHRVFTKTEYLKRSSDRPASSNPDNMDSNSQLSTDLYTGPVQLITQLYIFDFDGTLVDTPGPEEGKDFYKLLTGEEWPHPKWITQKESLEYPMCTKCSPGPALCKYFSHSTRAQSLTVVMTGRLSYMEAVVRSVLTQFAIYPDKLICKDDSSPLTTQDYKVMRLKLILDEYPSIQYVKVWDDLAENLAAFAQISTQFMNVEFELVDVISFEQAQQTANNNKKFKKSKVYNTVKFYGKTVMQTYSEAARKSIQFISELWGKCINYTENPQNLVLPFGSYPLKRQSDIDLVLLAPEKLPHSECISVMEQNLQQHGISYIHTSPTSRVPRIKLQCIFQKSPAISFDIIFLRMRDDSLYSEHLPLKLKELKKFILPNDAPSKIAFDGLLFLQKVKQSLIKDKISDDELAAIIEYIVLLLRSKNQKGNVFHCIRTFHIIKILLDFIETHKLKKAAFLSADEFVKIAFVELSKLNREDWTGYLNEFVPEQYISDLQAIFTNAANICSSSEFPSVATYHQLLSPLRYPQEDHMPLKLTVKCPTPILQFKYESIIEARLGTLIRSLIDSGVRISPAPSSGCEINFSCPNNSENTVLIQNSISKFIAKFSDCKNEVSLSFDIVNVMLNPVLESLQSLFNDIGKFIESKEKTLKLPQNLSSHQRLLVYEHLESKSIPHSTQTDGGNKIIVISKR